MDVNQLNTSGASVWISYNATGEPYVNMKFGAGFYSAFSAACIDVFGSDQISNTVFTPSLYFGSIHPQYAFGSLDGLKLPILSSQPTYIWTTSLSQWVMLNGGEGGGEGGAASNFAKKNFSHCNIQLKAPGTNPFMAWAPAGGLQWVPFPSPYICPSNQ